jgi:hypothetical protein
MGPNRTLRVREGKPPAGDAMLTRVVNARPTKMHNNKRRNMEKHHPPTHLAQA